ncbi:anti-anti-sigma factor [Streptomyces sp. NRRL F-4489]|uniref:STAS domain-containing protein n=1 Tax=Streptomyces sp. NRRL F-4489 TaxID=1609095 RepID=UPI000748F4FE|nr:STAS domain-containing protein [Streptomyces sp. NRRL F-4489]KUL37316.1 anti-anti-sigma factor [Streptomyces sp. NRRL F-4489]
MLNPELLTVEVTVIDERTAVVAVCGELDAETAIALHHQLANQLTHGRRHLVLDLRDVPFMDSSGLNIIIRAHNDTRKLGGSVRLAAVSPVVRRLLDLTGISVTAPLHDTPEEALFALAAATLPETEEAPGPSPAPPSS